ncbi:MAG: 16S rRNA (adenine(1518)-N(6)/adenine(1519)-N(6))-dimethyltransferase RsmA [Patescibacteria group bacterium]
MIIHPKKSLGQHFLINEGVIEKIVTAAELQSDDTVVEVGPGTGNLTKHLIHNIQRLILIEKDHRLIEPLRERFGDGSGVEIMEGDVLELNPSNLGLRASGFKLIANLPYYITSHFFKTIFELWPTPERIIVMVQKEVAQRIVANPPEANLLGLSVQLHATPKMIAHVSAGSFRPVPTVDSAVLKLVPHNQPLLSLEQEQIFFSLTRAAFAGKRKKLSNTLHGLVSESIFIQAEIDPSARPQHLTLEQWVVLARILESNF